MSRNDSYRFLEGWGPLGFNNVLKPLKKSQAVRNAYEHMKISPHKGGFKNLRKQNNTSTPPSSWSFSLRLHFPWLLAQLLRELFLEAAVYLETRLRESAQAPCGKHRPLSSGLRLGNGPDQRGQAANTPHSMWEQAKEWAMCVREGIYLRVRAS